MNYFEQREESRRRTRLAWLLYGLALGVLAVLVDVVLAAAWRWGFPEIYGTSVPPMLYVLGALVTVALVGGATLRDVLRLRAGGEALARLLGARRVPPETRDTLERRLVNILEETAIAAGTRVPALYVMDTEPAINALAATTETSGAVLVVTRGALQTLNRDELQGVVGHELCHLISGEAELHLRMLPLARGLGALPYAGRALARFMKSSLTRSREYAADAGAAQFIANPTGVAGALDQVRASAAGALLAHRYAEPLSHAFFEAPVKPLLPGLFSSHPPLDERIRRVLPSFVADDYRARRARAAAEAPEAPQRPTTAEGKRAGDQAHRWWRTPEESLGFIGTLQPGKLDYARRLMEVLPQQAREALRKKEGAPAVVMALMLAPHEEVMQRQVAAAKAAGAGGLADAAAAAAPQIASLSQELRMAAVELALPALQLAPADARARLVASLDAVVRADRRASLHASVVLAWLRIGLGLTAHAGAGRGLAALSPESALVLSLVAHTTGTGAAEVEAAFRAGAKLLGVEGAVPEPREKLSSERCSAAIERLRALGWPAKAGLMRALFAAVAADGKVRLSEAQAMRFLGSCLGCPMPPLLEAL